MAVVPCFKELTLMLIDLSPQCPEDLIVFVWLVPVFLLRSRKTDNWGKMPAKEAEPWLQTFAQLT
jgi:hypothetical protein